MPGNWGGRRAGAGRKPKHIIPLTPIGFDHLAVQANPADPAPADPEPDPDDVPGVPGGVVTESSPHKQPKTLETFDLDHGCAMALSKHAPGSRKEGERVVELVPPVEGVQVFAGDIERTCRGILEDPVAVERMRRLYRAGRLHPRLVVLFHEYAYGRPAQRLEVSGALAVPQSITFVVVQAANSDNRT